MTRTPLISLTEVSLGYNGQPLLREISFSVLVGEFLAILGPNGAGKTTLVRALLGQLRPLGGRLERAAVQGERLRTGYVAQSASLDPIFPFSVADIVLQGRLGRRHGLQRLSATDRDEAARCLDEVGLSHLATMPFRDLSGGQKQRLLIARALATQPHLLLLDEPTRGLDLASRHAILDLIATLHRRRGLTIVLITHVLAEATRLAERVALVHHGRVTSGATAELLQPDRLGRLYDMDVELLEES
ncbi:MAG: metal ABC transporter ATP-binding protein [Candidatus Tectomicrobia bacterium]|nr:metal ABC transporter ATP-binding protein [Candidatus Tectomicrobia bacterium]